MKILLVGPVPPSVGSKNPGGIAHHVWTLANKLHKKGHDISIMALGRYYKGDCTLNGITVLGLSNLFQGLLYLLIYWPVLISKVRKQSKLKKYLHVLYSFFRLCCVKNLDDYDVIHIHGLHNAVLHGLDLLKVKTPSVISIHSYTGIISSDKAKTSSRTRYINDYLKLPDGIIHVSNTDKKKGEKHGINFSGKYSEVIYNGVIKGTIEPIEHNAGICFVGNLIEEKRVLLFLESTKLLKSTIEQIHIVGDGPLRREVEQEVKGNSKAFYEGILPNEKVRKMMRKFSVLVVPSISESFGLVYIEALFEGMAVIGYGPVIEEFHEKLKVTDKEKKLMVALPANEIKPEVLARKIDDIYQFRRSEEGIKAMKTLRRKAIQNFNWDKIISQAENTYIHLLRETT